LMDWKSKRNPVIYSLWLEPFSAWKDTWHLLVGTLIDESYLQCDNRESFEMPCNDAHCGQRHLEFCDSNACVHVCSWNHDWKMVWSLSACHPRLVCLFTLP
jgi:hypothetical protein